MVYHWMIVVTDQMVKVMKSNVDDNNDNEMIGECK